LRYHLGIEVPERDIQFRVHDQLITWKQDRCIKIDDSYEHEVFQQSDRRRVVFVLDLPHPELRPEDSSSWRSSCDPAWPGRLSKTSSSR
jgi:aspartyl/asparaginyl beta-hydroxylase (cupin superfamily)